ncbi:MAG TPA: histidine phosphatase family protein [Aeromicrobium sp.]|nr:histidine phosphatase family protein [Aeromicrobium sp.]
MRNVSWLGIVRHGESTGNVAAVRAQADLAETIDIDLRDADVPLSSTGKTQARAVREWMASSSTTPPDAVVVSPFRRARETAELALEGLALTPTVDERLRDRDLGVLDLLTKTGIEARMPEESRRRARLGKFYYRPPGGESWADVLLRLRSLLRDIDEDHPQERVLLFAHDATVSMMRYLLEGMDEQTLMETARKTPIANCSISSWRREGRTWVPEVFNDVSHIEQADAAEPTAEEDVDAQIK